MKRWMEIIVFAKTPWPGRKDGRKKRWSLLTTGGWKEKSIINCCTQQTLRKGETSRDYEEGERESGNSRREKKIELYRQRAYGQMRDEITVCTVHPLRIITTESQWDTFCLCLRFSVSFYFYYIFCSLSPTCHSFTARLIAISLVVSVSHVTNSVRMFFFSPCFSLHCKFALLALVCVSSFFRCSPLDISFDFIW